MSQVRKILIVDDDTELRSALAEQLSLYDEFSTVVAENATKGAKSSLEPFRTQKDYVRDAFLIKKMI